MVKCPFCNFENEDGALFCEQCKTDLGGEPPAIRDQGRPLSAEEASAPTVPLASSETAPPVAAVVVEAMREHDTVPIAEAAEEKPPEGDFPSAAVSDSQSALATPPSAIPVSDAPADRFGSEPTVSVEPERIPQVPPLAPPAEAGRLPEGAKPKLVVLRGQRVNAEYQIYDGDNYIGRADDKPVDVDLEDQEPPDRIWSSRQHALISFEGGQLTIEDLNSLNGTFVNRTRVPPGQRRPLQVNDVIQIGTVQMKVKV
jgi:hypothetical protein